MWSRHNIREKILAEHDGKANVNYPLKCHLRFAADDTFNLRGTVAQWLSALLEIKWSLEELCCVNEQDTLSTA